MSSKQSKKAIAAPQRRDVQTVIGAVRAPLPSPTNGQNMTDEEAQGIREMVFDSLGTYLAPEKFSLLMQPPPVYAIKTREGGKGAMYRYLKHGYVKLKLTQIPQRLPGAKYTLVTQAIISVESISPNVHKLSGPQNL